MPPLVVLVGIDLYVVWVPPLVAEVGINDGATRGSCLVMLVVCPCLGVTLRMRGRLDLVGPGRAPGTEARGLVLALCLAGTGFPKTVRSEDRTKVTLRFCMTPGHW